MAVAPDHITQTRSVPESMCALKKVDAAPGLSWCEAVPTPRPGPRDVIVAVSHVGLCGTDRHIYEWDAWSAGRIPLGIIVGHEFVGRVAAVGDAVVRTRPGDRVSGEGHIGCGYCQPCRTGNGHICETVDIIGVDRDGCFAEFISIPEDNIWLVDDSISDEMAASLDPLGNAMHAVTAANVSGRSVLITGVGVIGLMATAMVGAAGASQVIAVDVDHRKLGQAKAFGADLCLDAADEHWPEKARAATQGQGPERWLEMSGSAAAIRGGFHALRNGGTAALLGLPPNPVPLDLPNDIIFKGATVLGINGRKMYETWYQVEAYLTSGRLDLSSIITHRFALHEFEEAFNVLIAGEATKVLMSLTERS